MSNSLFKKQDYVFLSVVFIVFYFINSLYMQVHDDVTYTFFNGARNVSWTDAIVANAYDYLHVNGRFIVHTFVRWMCGGHRVHFYALGCAFSLCLLLASSLAIIRRKVQTAGCDKYILLTLLCVLTPQFNMTFMGNMAEVVNYLWTGALVMAFMLALDVAKDKKHMGHAATAVLFVTGIVIGSLQESFSIGLAGATFLLLLFRKDYRVPAFYIPAIGFWIGTCIGVFAPSNFLRFKSSTPGDADGFVVAMVKRSLKVVLLSWLPMMLLLVALLKRKSQLVRDNLLYLASAGISILFTCVVAFTARHQLTFPVLLGILAVVVLAFAYRGGYLLKTYSKYISVVLGVLLLVSSGFVYYYRSLLFEGYNDYISQARKADHSYISFHKFYHAETEVVGQSLLCYFALQLSATAKHPNVCKVVSKYVSEDTDEVKVSVILPDSLPTLEAHCIPAHEVGPSVYTNPTWHYYIVKVKPTEMHKQVHLHYAAKSITAKVEKLFGLTPSSASIPLAEVYPSIQSENYVYAIIYETDVNNVHWVIDEVKLGD